MKNIISKSELLNLKKKLNEEKTLFDVIRYDKESAIKILTMLNDGTVYPKTEPKLSEPDFTSDEGVFNDDITLYFDGSDLSLFFNIEWKYKIVKGQESANKNIIPDDPNECVLQSMQINEFTMFLGETAPYNVEIDSEIEKLAINYFSDFCCL